MTWGGRANKAEKNVQLDVFQQGHKISGAIALTLSAWNLLGHVERSERGAERNDLQGVLARSHRCHPIELMEHQWKPERWGSAALGVDAKHL